MGPFDAILHRRERREAADRYAERLAQLTPAATREEVAAAQRTAAVEAGEHLVDRHRRRIDEELEVRLSLEAAEAYGDALVELPLEAVLDGSWRDRFEQLGARWSTWLRDEHRADQHWQAGEAALHGALDQGRTSDDDVAALDAFLAEVDPDGPTTLTDPWYARFAAARLEHGHLPRPRGEPRLIVQEGETVVFTEPGEVLQTVEWMDSQDRLRTRTEATPVRVEASDRRVAVFGDELLFSTRWVAVVGASTGEDEHGPYVQLDDADAHATHVVHTALAELVAAMARELHRRAN